MYQEISIIEDNARLTTKLKKIFEKELFLLELGYLCVECKYGSQLAACVSASHLESV